MGMFDMVMEYFEELFKLVQSNPIAASIFGASTIAGIVVWARNLPTRVVAFLIERVTKTLTLNSRDNYFNISIMTAHIEKIYFSPTNAYGIDSDLHNKHDDKLTVGESATLYCKLFGRFCKVTKRVSGMNNAITFGGNMLAERQLYQFTILAFSPKILFNWYGSIYKNHTDRLKIRTEITCSIGERVFGKALIHFDNLVLPKNIKDCVGPMMDNLEHNYQFYQDRNIPHKEGLLLYGNPGCGKSLFIQGIASKYQYDLVYINLNSVVSELDLLNTFMNAHLKSIFLIEDIDCQLNADVNRNNQKGESGLSLSFLLNILDGVLTKPKQFIVVTTNKLEALDPALIREGRFNTQLEFKPFDKELILEYLKMFYVDTLTKEYLIPITQFLEQNPDSHITPAKLTSVCMRHRDISDRLIGDLCDTLKSN